MKKLGKPPRSIAVEEQINYSVPKDEIHYAGNKLCFSRIYNDLGEMLL